mmetsp:Transcript_46606/g.92352  ORF Transcript_46606/g.92352 Transcript_46606/m.92352 type:complete len:316 (-) Transcript_46606:71-1018(-)
MLKTIESLQLAKQRKIEASDRHRKLQIKNIEALYEYEVEDATALFNKAYADLQEELISDLQSDRDRRIQAATETSKRKRGSSAPPSVADSAAAVTAAAAGGRSLRSSAPTGSDGAEGGGGGSGGGGNGGNSYGREYAYSRSGNSAAGNGASANGSASGGGGADTTTTSSRRRTSANAGLDYALPETTMRSDFVDIVRDLHSRAVVLEQTKSKSLEREVRISGDLSELYVCDETYGAGDLVVVFSVLSQESFQGIITALSHQEIVVRSPTGARLKVLVGQIRCGRVVLSKDKETMENALIFKTAAEMQAVQDKYYK